MTGEVRVGLGLEEQARALLAASVAGLDARTRSRLNEARHAALAASLLPRRARWRGRRLTPVTGAIAAALAVTVLLVHGSVSHRTVPGGATSQPSLEVLDLLTNDESLSLMENDDHGFYEWAAAQGDAPEDSGRG